MVGDFHLVEAGPLHLVVVRDFDLVEAARTLASVAFVWKERLSVLFHLTFVVAWQIISQQHLFEL